MQRVFQVLSGNVWQMSDKCCFPSIPPIKQGMETNGNKFSKGLKGFVHVLFTLSINISDEGVNDIITFTNGTKLGEMGNLLSGWTSTQKGLHSLGTV